MTGGAAAATAAASRAASLPTPKAATAAGGGAAAAAGKRTPVASYKLENGNGVGGNAANVLTTPGGGFKSCYQCGATKTPQWREGPEGLFCSFGGGGRVESFPPLKKQEKSSLSLLRKKQNLFLSFRPQDPLQRLRRQARPRYPRRRRRRRRRSGGPQQERRKGFRRRRQQQWRSVRRQAQRRQQCAARLGLRDDLCGICTPVVQPLRPRGTR